MAAKAKSKSSTGDKIWFNDAVTERVDTWGSEEDAEQALIRELKAGLPWSHLLPDETRVPGDAKFWNDPNVVVDRKNNRAKIGILISNTSPFWRDGHSDVPSEVFGIKVARVAGPKRKPGPGAERLYDHAAFAAAAKAVVERGKPDTKALFYEKVRDELHARKIKAPPEDDETTLRRVVGPLYDDAA